MDLPDVLIDSPDGEIRVKGSRISLFHLVGYFERGFSPPQIHDQLESLSLGQIEGVFEFYRRNRAEVEKYVAAEQAAIDRYRAENPPGPSLEEMRRRWEQRKASVE